MITLIEQGDIHTPKPTGVRSVLLDGDKIIKIGEVDRKGLDLLKLDYDVIDASGCHVVPGFIDPHQHLLGGSGEGDLARQSPMIFLSEIVPFGITTVVGVLGVDTTMKTMAGLLARVKALNIEGITARMWAGGYNVPPTTVMSSIREDMLFIDECLGAGEIAISDKRSLQQGVQQLAEVVLDTHVGGLLTGKAGVTHLHVGEEESRLKPLRDLLENFRIDPGWLYPTHITRTRELLDEAIALARGGSCIDTDTIESGVHKWVRYYLEHGGPPGKLTLSSDAGITAPRHLYDEFRSCVVDHGISLDVMLPMVTSNTADVLKLTLKGRIETGKDADVVVMRKGSLDIVEVIAKGQRLVRDGSLAVTERFLEESDRVIELRGTKGT